jgi:hypothetical protein
MLIQREDELADLRGLADELHRSTQEVHERIREARAQLVPHPPLIVFVHIPKTAGATVKFMFANAYSRGALRDAGNYLTRPEAAVSRVSTPPRGGWEAWSRRGGRVTIGHTPYGLFRQHVPARTRYITFLRDPVERVLSHYHRHLRLTGTPADQRKPGLQLTASIEEALDLGLPELSNLATRLLCDFPPPPGELPATALDVAKANLREFAFVGIQERFEESIVLLQRRFGLGLVSYLDRHVADDRPTTEEIPEEQRAKIAEQNQLDAELYSFAQELFEEAVAATDDGFSADVEALRTASEAANEEAMQKARDWLLRELPVGVSRSKLEMVAAAQRAGVSAVALKDLVTALPVTRQRNNDGEVIWSLTREAREFGSRADLQINRRRVGGGRDRTDLGVRGETLGPESLIAFVHVERTAGATVSSVFENAFSSPAVRQAGDYFRDPDASAARLGQPPKRGWEAWRRGGGRAVVGHVPYGLFRKYMPSDPRYVTFLREPVDRVLSHYHGLLQRQGGPDDQPGPTADSLEEALVEMRLPQLNNLATRYLCGDPSPLGELPASAVEDAKTNLREFVFVGLQERFDESLVLLARTLGLQIHPCVSANINVDRPGVDDVPDEERELILEHNRLDVELYAFARGFLEEALADVEDDFSAEVAALRTASDAWNEKAIQEALDWLDRELPAGSSAPKRELMAKAKASGVPIAAVRQALRLLSVTRDTDAEGQIVWSRPEEAHS